MRTTLASLLAALLALGCGPSDDDPTDRGDDTGGDEEEDEEEVPLPTGVLIFHGRGGVGPEGMWGDMTHEGTITYLEERGLDVTQTASWPSSLADLRLVLLPAPGFTELSPFSGGEVSAMRAFVEAGGIVTIEAENGAVLDYGVINPLLLDLGATAQMEGGFWNGQVATIAAHPLTVGVAQVGLAAAGGMDAGADVCLAASDAQCLVSAAAVGEGYVVLIGDGNTFSNLESWDTSGSDNRRLLANLARLAP